MPGEFAPYKEATYKSRRDQQICDFFSHILIRFPVRSLMNCTPQTYIITEHSVRRRQLSAESAGKKSCECGCGEYPKNPRSRFLPGHDLRKAYNAGVLGEWKAATDALDRVLDKLQRAKPSEQKKILDQAKALQSKVQQFQMTIDSLR
jgi:hypothetical protein